MKYYNDPQLPRALNEMLRCRRYDILQVEHSELSGVIRAIAAEHLNNTRTLLTFHNVVHLRDHSMLAIERRPYERVKLMLNWVSMKAWERALATEFHTCIAMSPFDCEALSSLAGDISLFIVPNGADTHALKPLPVNDSSRNLLFVGDCSYPPNRDAVLWFYEQIFGIIRDAVPDVRLSIVGKRPDQCIRRLAADSSVSVWGHVEDVVPFYERAAVSIVPLRAGGGTRLKILESMALGRPVVSTSTGCQGLNVTQGQNILIADEPKRFAESIVKLLHDTNLRRHLIGNARQLVEADYDWDVIARTHAEVYQWLVSPESVSQWKRLG